MTAGWVAGTVRAAALAQRRLTPGQRRELAYEPTARSAVVRLATTPYGHDVAAAHELAQAQHAVGATLLWHLRVLAGWVPRQGAHALRVLAAGFEVANVDDHLVHLAGGTVEPPYVLGALETAWSRLARTHSPEQLRAALTASPWGDPGSAVASDVHLTMTLAWAERVAEVVPEAAEWARAAAALTVLRDALLVRQAPPTGRVAARTVRLLGPRFAAAVTGPVPTLQQAVERLPRGTRRLFDGVTEPADLWRVELAWLHRLEEEGSALLRRGGYGPEHLVGTVAVLAADAWRARAALEAAALGETPGPAPPAESAAEVLDALA